MIECYGCGIPARFSYRDVPLCRWHLMLLYFGLLQDWRC